MGKAMWFAQPPWRWSTLVQLWRGTAWERGGEGRPWPPRGWAQRRVLLGALHHNPAHQLNPFTASEILI